MKCCSKCGESKELTQFNKNNAAKDGHKSECRTCSAEVSTIYRRIHRSPLKDILVEHHVKYKEIHGVDETVWMTMSEHTKLHLRLRREGKCNVPVDELHKIATSANQRTDKSRIRVQNYNKMWYNSEVGSEYHKNYKKNIKHKSFNSSPYPNILLREIVCINENSGNTSVTSSYCGQHGLKIPIIDINDEVD